jgi:hypothetical protein
MAHKNVATYLNDHLAGSTTVLELLEHLAAAYAGGRIAQFATELRAEITADRLELEALMAKLNVTPSGPRRASAWLVEKLAELKLRIDAPTAGALRLLEATEAISLGIEGKRLLWLALADAARNEAGLCKTDYDRLIRRAEDQRRRVETVRLEAARAVLVVAPQAVPSG